MKVKSSNTQLIHFIISLQLMQNWEMIGKYLSVLI